LPHGKSGAIHRIALVLPSHDALVAELSELIAIPSVSADPAHAGDLARAADWVATRIRAAGGDVEIAERDGRPLVLGEVPASPEGAPAVLAYAHLDVQPPDPLDLWESDPWTLTERDGLLVGRGVADDKAHLFMLLKATELLAAAGELPVTVRFMIDAEEEVGGHSVCDWAAEDSGPANAAVILDGGYATATLPAFCTALRGIGYFHVSARTGARDLHSGMVGGAALNAIEALMRSLAAVLPGQDGRLPEPLRAGIIPPTDAEVAGWSALPCLLATPAAVRPARKRQVTAAAMRMRVLWFMRRRLRTPSQRTVRRRLAAVKGCLWGLRRAAPTMVIREPEAG